jgi:hypothetical protein
MMTIVQLLLLAPKLVFLQLSLSGNFAINPDAPASVLTVSACNDSQLEGQYPEIPPEWIEATPNPGTSNNDSCGLNFGTDDRFTLD